MNYRYFAVLVMILISSSAFADTIVLKTGKKISGKIIEEQPSGTVINVNGIIQKYFKDQIERIEKEVDYTKEPLSIDPKKFPNISPNKVSLIATYLFVSGSQNNLATNIENIINSAPEDKKKKTKEIFNIVELFENIIPVYDRYYSEAELTDLIRFYQSSTGQKFISVTPDLLQEVMKVSVQYFSEKQ